MNTKKTMIQSILAQLAEEAIQPEKIDLWPVLQKRLAEKEQHSRPGSISAANRLAPKKRIVFTVVCTLILFFAGILLITPQGRTFAQNILRYFIRVEGNEIPLPTPVPVHLIPVSRDISQPTHTPAATIHPAFYDRCGEGPNARCSLDEIRAMVDFPVQGLVEIPAGMSFIGATGGPSEIVLTYRSDDPLCVITLSQGKTDPAAETGWLIAGEAAVETVQIGNAEAEYLQGGWFSYGGDKTARWDPQQNMQVLRWEEQERFYLLSVSAEEGTDALGNCPDKAGVIALAAGLTENSHPAPLIQATVTPVVNLAEIGQTAGFKAVEPTWLPEGYRLSSARYVPEQEILCIEYTHPDDIPLSNRDAGNLPAPSLSIAQRVSAPLPDLKELVPEGLRPDQVLLEKENLAVGGSLNGNGEYVYGSIDPTPLCGNILEHQALQFEMEPYRIMIFARKIGGINLAQRGLTKQEMVKVAESMTGVRRIAEDQPDPEFLTSVDEAETLSGFSIKLPGKLPEGMNLDHIRVDKNGGQRSVTLYYSDGSQMLEISQVSGNGETLEAIRKDHPEAFDTVTVHDQPALISQGYWTEDGWKELEDGGDGGASLSWFEDGIGYTVSGFNKYPRTIWIEIADSLK